MQSVSSRIWTRVAVSISCDDNHYTTGNIQIIDLIFIIGWKVLLSKIIWRLQVQFQQQGRLTRNTYYNLTLVPGHD